MDPDDTVENANGARSKQSQDAEMPGGTIKLLLELAQALQELEPDLRRDYDQAMETVPELVREETKFFDFLRTEDMDPNRAAHRIATYWQVRREIFGEERWLLPLTLSGEGALSEEDIAVLQRGHITPIARPGKPTVFMHNTSVQFETRFPSEWRVIMFLAYAFAEEIIQKEGCIVMHLILHKYNSKRPLDKPLSRLFGCIPARIKKSLIVMSLEAGREQLADSLAFHQDRVFEFRSGIKSTHVAGKSNEETLRLLEEHGIEQDCVPPEMGGTFDYDSIGAWIEERQKFENAVYGTTNVGLNHTADSPKAQPEASNTAKPPGVTSAASSVTESRSADSDMQESEISREEFLRKRNAMYVRRFYRKRNMQIATMQDEVKEWERKNDDLRKNNRVLEQYLAQARHLAAQFDAWQN